MRRFQAGYRIAAGAVAALAAAGLGLDQAGVLFDFGSGQTIAAWAALAVIGIGTPALEEYATRHLGATEAAKLRWEMKSRAVLRTLALNMVTQYDAEWTSPGAGLYFPKTGEEIRLLYYEHIGDRQSSAPRRWLRGKGVVGSCWAEGTPISSVNWGAPLYTSASETSSSWARLTAPKFGLSHSDYLALDPKLGVLTTALLTDDNRCVGVLFVDCDPSDFMKIDVPKARAELGLARRIVESYLTEDGAPPIKGL